MAHMILGVDHVPGRRTLHKNSLENVVGLHRIWELKVF